eukprot:945638-Pelagomonas_calceolata.AAC.1
MSGGIEGRGEIHNEDMNVSFEKGGVFQAHDYILEILFLIYIWLAEGKKQEHNAGTSTAPTSNPKITYLPNLQNALKSPRIRKSAMPLGTCP